MILRIAEYFRLLPAMALAVVATGVADAQEPPKGPVVILVGFSAGGTTDLIARLMAEKIENALRRPVVVENKPGAGGRIAAGALKSATPDGATLMVAPIVVPVLAPLVYRQLDYDPVRDFAPVAQVAQFQFAFAVGADHPARTLSQFVDWAKSNHSRASFGTPGAGSIPHFLGVMIATATGIEMTHVAYQGLPRLTSDLIGGQIPAAIYALPDLIALHRAGKIRILATSGASRSPLSPMVPTFSEQGFASIEATSWVAIYAPAKTPDPLVARLSGVISTSLQAPELRERLVGLGYEPTGTTPAELAAIMAADTTRWAPIIKASGFHAE